MPGPIAPFPASSAMVAPAQLTVKLVVAVPPAGTETLWGFALVTVQLLATVSATL